MTPGRLTWECEERLLNACRDLIHEFPDLGEILEGSQGRHAQKIVTAAMRAHGFAQAELAQAREREKPRCPECGSWRIRQDEDRDDEGNVTDQWLQCEGCLHQWSEQQPPLEPAAEKDGEAC
jgi:hypothetical protein